MLKDTNLDGLIIASPPSTHEEIAIAALNSKIPVLIEKPIVMKLDGVSKIFNLAIKKKLPVLVDYIHLYSPYFNRIQKLCKNTKILKIKEKKDVVIVDRKEYDYSINCTWGAIESLYRDKIYFEPCVTYLYKKVTKDEFALTIMDGNFISLYPYKSDIYSLTSVKNTPMGRFDNYSDADQLIKDMEKNEFNSIRRLFEEEVIFYYPDFLDEFCYYDYYTSIKTKKSVNNACREASINKNGRKISVLSGKIDTIYFVEQYIYEAINL